MTKYIEAEMVPAAWKITYVSADGTNKTAIHGHNAIGDYKAIDAGAKSEPIYATAQPVQPQRVPLTDEQIDAAWRSVDYKLKYEDFRMALGRAIEAEVRKEIEAAVLAEREACAKVCAARYMGDCNREDLEARRCADAIRSRTQPMRIDDAHRE